MTPYTFLPRLFRRYGNVTDEAILDAMPELELLRQEFYMRTSEWLPEWYRSRALEEAVFKRDISDTLGPSGLELFKSDVEELSSFAGQIALSHLGDEVWWHYDQAQTEETVIYSVRLCMGWLAVPLWRSGYLMHYEWRESLNVLYDVPTGQTDERGRPVFRSFSRGRDVPSKRPFCREGYDEGEQFNCPKIWPSEMTETLKRYFKLVEETKRRSQESREDRERAQEQRKAAGVEQILGFQPIITPPASSPFRFPAPPP